MIVSDLCFICVNLRLEAPSRKRQTKPWSIIAFATLRKPAMFAPFT